MRRDDFWPAFAAGAVLGTMAGIGGVLLFKRLSSGTDSHILRLEKSINIGLAVEAVFDAWSNFERLPQLIDFVEKIERFGTQSRWWVNIDGRQFQWDAQITKVAQPVDRMEILEWSKT